jgi:hypothetical protein
MRVQSIMIARDLPSQAWSAHEPIAFAIAMSGLCQGSRKIFTRH